jgi:hypothetical protein
MRVIVPYTQISRDCAECLERFAPHAERVYVGGDPLDYWRLMCWVWGDREDFAVIEHDTLFDADAITALETCSEPWCSELNYFQMTRFRREMMEALPDAFEAIRPSWRHWTALEAGVHDAFEEEFGGLHRHLGPGGPRNDTRCSVSGGVQERWIAWAEWMRGLPPEDADDNTRDAWLWPDELPPVDAHEYRRPGKAGKYMVRRRNRVWQRICVPGLTPGCRSGGVDREIHPSGKVWTKGEGWISLVDWP